METAEAFAPAWWARGAHLQTAWARLARSRRLVTFEREVLTTPDDDDLMLDHLTGPQGTPRVLLLHGLEGSAHSLHSQGLALLVAQRGWRATVLNFRSCARDPGDIRRRLRNRRPRLYHAGDTADLDLVVRLLAAREPGTPLYAVGFSLGGNVLLKWLGETQSRDLIAAAVTLSVPYDLAAASRFLERRTGKLYVLHFMHRLRAKALDVLHRFPHETAHIDGGRVRAARTLREFDAAVTAPLHGFAGVDEYYRQSSSGAYLPRVSIPSLCISSSDDPLFPADALAEASRRRSPDVSFEVTALGGHVGFVAGRWPWRPRYWAEERAIDWLAAQTQPSTPATRPVSD